MATTKRFIVSYISRSGIYKGITINLPFKKEASAKKKYLSLKKLGYNVSLKRWN